MAIEAIPGWVNALQNAESVGGTVGAYGVVPVLYRAVNLRADALSSVPYLITRKGVPVNWPFKSALPNLIRDTERALLLKGAAYWLRLFRGNVLIGFQQLNPNTVRVYPYGEFDAADPLAFLRFEQRISGKQYGPWGINEIVYFREPSLIDDYGPGLAPAAVALQSAQLSHYIERFASAFFEHGAQPVTIMSMPSDMAENEFKRFKLEYMNRFIGVWNSFRTLFVRGGDIKAQSITPALKDLMLNDLAERVNNSVGTVFGVPQTMLEASAANYATANSDRQSFWRETIIPRLSVIQQIINEQLLFPLGYELTFQPETLDVMQTDEAQRAGSLLQLVQAGVPLAGAMDILGYKNIEDVLQINTSNNTGVVDPNAPKTPEPLPSERATPEPAPLPALPLEIAYATAQFLDDLTRWEQKAIRRLKSGGDGTKFVGSSIPAPLELYISHSLKSITEPAEIRAFFAGIKATQKIRANEKKLYNKLVRILANAGDVWARQVLADGNGDDPNLSQLIKPAMVSELTNVANTRIDALGTQFQYPMGAEQRNVTVNGYLETYLPKFGLEIDKTTSDVLTKAIALYRTTPGMTITDLRDVLTPAFGEIRAATIAITEITRASTQTTNSYEKFLNDAGIKTEMVWNTDADELVCRICKPYDNKLIDVWGIDSPEGPPAHPNCRCDVTLRLVK
jgi:HK97 family phage portal protein